MKCMNGDTLWDRLRWCFVLALIATCLPFTHVAAAVLPFAAPSNTSVGTSPAPMASADFNGDGITDLAVENAGDGTLSILFGTGNGAFTVRTGVSLGTSGDHGPAHSLVSGEFNGDGHADIALLFHTANQIKVLLGSGSSTAFSSTSTTVNTFPSTVSAPDEVVVADIDADGIQDLVVAGDSAVAVFRGDGVGGFSQMAAPTALAAAPVGMVFANFGGGPRGIALVEAGSNSVTVLKSDGAGGFTAMPTPTTSGTSPSAIAVWYPDHLTGCLAVTYAGSRNVNLLYGFGDGTFALGHGGVPLTTGISTNPRAVTLDDINGDGISDLLVANNSGGASTSVVNVLLGASNGSFGSVGSLSGFTEPGDILLADVTGDTKPDLIAVSAATNTVSAAINIGPYVAASLALSAPSSSVPNTPFQLSVTARDKFGNIATGYRGTIHFTGGGAGATFPPDYTFTASDNGFHTFTVTIAATGSQTITASDTVTVTPPNSPTFTLTGATSIYVIPQPASTLVVTTPASVAAGTSFSFTVTVQDTSGNTVTDFEGAVQFTSTDSLVSLPGTYGFTNTDQGTHTFTATMHTAGSRTLSATMVGSPGVTSTATITVTGPNITGITPASGPANGGVTFTIRGSGFTGATSVMFGGVNAATFTVTNDTTMTGTTPTNQPSATVDVTVTTPQGVASFHGYTFLPASVAPLPAPKTTQANTSGGPAPDTIPQRRP